MTVPTLRFGGLDTSQRVLVVAEIGNNHEGSVDVARELVRRAAECRVDAVKFQTYRTDRFVRPSDAARHARLRSFELSFDEFRSLARLAKELGLAFVSTPLDLESARFLAEIVDCFKIASGDIDFLPMLEVVASSGKPLIVSTGASDIALVRRTIAFLKGLVGDRLGTRVALLHCVSSYPAPHAEVNIRAIRALEHLGCVAGYSDHTAGSDAVVVAVTMGARIIEKHFTLRHDFSDFRDHQLAADPNEMAECVRRVRNAEEMLGDGCKRVQPSEEPMVGAIRRSIVSGSDLPAGHVLTIADIAWMRPAGGLAPGQEAALIGRRLRRAVALGEQLGERDVE